MDYVHVLSTSNSQTISEKILGVFDDVEAARDAGLWWSIDNDFSSDIAWYKSTHNLETVQIGKYQWLHIKTVKSGILIEN